MTLRSLCSAVIAGAALCATAQPTLTSTTSVPVPPQDVEVLTANDYIGASAAGADLSHDYWNMLVPQTGTRNIYYRGPGVTPTSEAIPSATLLSTDGGSDTLFWAVTSQGLEQVGVRTNLEGIINFSDPGLELKLPCTYLTAWTDNVGASYVVSGIIPVTRVGTITGLADMYGSLRMPDQLAPVENVLRVKLRRDITDNSAVANVHRIANVYSYYSQDLTHPLLILTQDSVQITGGAWTVTKSAQWQGEDFTIGMEDLVAAEQAFTAYPNPAIGNVDIHLGTDAAIRSVEVLNGIGQVVMRPAFRAASGTEIKNAFDVSGLNKGVYYVQLTYADGTRRAQPLLVR